MCKPLTTEHDSSAKAENTTGKLCKAVIVIIMNLGLFFVFFFFLMLILSDLYKCLNSLSRFFLFQINLKDQIY